MVALTSHPSLAQEDFTLNLIDVFGDLADLFGNPRSHGQIYGVLFASSDALLMDEIAKLCKISLASTSNGLRTLEEFGAVVREMQGRQGYYRARMELKALINGFVGNRLHPKLKKAGETLAEAGQLLSKMTPQEAEEAQWRLDRVLQWHRRATQILPIAEKLLGSASLLHMIPKK